MGDGVLNRRHLMADERMHEECGLFGIDAPGEDVANLTYFGLYALQHRGQESAGIATSDGQTIRMHKDMGLVAQAFDQPALERLTGHRRPRPAWDSAAVPGTPSGWRRHYYLGDLRARYRGRRVRS